MRGSVPYFAVAGVIIALDQVTKAVVRGQLGHGERWPAGEPLLGVFRFTHVHNTGMAFGLGKGQGWLFLLLALVIVAGLTIGQTRLDPKDWSQRAILGLLAGGAVGNAIDRMRLGHVTDFFDFLVWPVFNIADSAISVGVVLLAIHLWREERALAAAQADPVHL